MATTMERVEAHVGKLMRDAKAAPGVIQAGKEFGTGEQRRVVGITYDGDERYTAELVAWGHPARYVSGTAGEVFAECIDAYGV